MKEINREAVKAQIVNVLADLKNLAALYMRGEREAAKMEANAAFARTYRDAEIKRIRDQQAGEAEKVFGELRAHFGRMVEAMQENDKVYDFSSPDFVSCLTLLTAAEHPLPLETITGICEKFAGNRQALLALAEVAKERNQETFRERIFNTEARTTNLIDRIDNLEVGFPKSVLMIPNLKNSFVEMAHMCGVELDETETDLGTDYQEIVTAQMRAVMGLPN